MELHRLRNRSCLVRGGSLERWRSEFGLCEWISFDLEVTLVLGAVTYSHGGSSMYWPAECFGFQVLCFDAFSDTNNIVEAPEVPDVPEVTEAPESLQTHMYSRVVFVTR